LLVIFFADVNRLIAAQQMHHLPDTTHQWDQYITGTIDATIACTQAMDAAINMGLGTCFIGGLRRFASQINQTLNVNGTAIPVVAMTFGHSTEPGTHRPKVNKCYDELYNNELLIKELHEYDEQSKIYYDQVYKKNIS
jgi:FMN reductase [NAD(P)H]